MVELQGELDELGTSVEQGFGMHPPIVPSPAIRPPRLNFADCGSRPQ
jgi:hypothetical protein